MATLTLSVKSQESNGVTYAIPTKPDFTTRFRYNTVNKSLNGLVVPNYATEIISNDLHSVTIAGQSVLDALSIRIRVSGSLASKARLHDMLCSLAVQLHTWEGENVMQGFRPTTAPQLIES